MILKESRYLSCDEWAAGIYSRGDEVDELALVLTVDLTVELCKPVGVSLQGGKGLRMTETHTHTHTYGIFVNCDSFHTRNQQHWSFVFGSALIYSPEITRRWKSVAELCNIKRQD